MTQVIVTFKLKDEYNPSNCDSIEGFSSDEMDDLLREIAEKNEMDLISWGTI